MWTVLIGTLLCVNVISGEDHHLLRRSTKNVTHAVNKVREMVHESTDCYWRKNLGL